MIVHCEKSRSRLTGGREQEVGELLPKLRDVIEEVMEGSREPVLGAELRGQLKDIRDPENQTSFGGAFGGCRRPHGTNAVGFRRPRRAQNRLRLVGDPFSQFLRFQHQGVLAEAENPASDFLGIG